nr:MAG TPA: hypothetical protein [Caudoviricetes sp.]
MRSASEENIMSTIIVTLVCAVLGEADRNV